MLCREFGLFLPMAGQGSSRHTNCAVAAIAQVIGDRVVGRRPIMRYDISALEVVVPTNPDGGVCGVRIAINVAAATTGAVRTIG